MKSEVLDPVLESLPTSDHIPSPESVGDQRDLADHYKADPHTIRMMSVMIADVVQLSKPVVTEARRVLLRTASVGVVHAVNIDYTQRFPDRWSWANPLARSIKGQYPRRTDCSGYVSWVYEDALMWLKLGDILNGLNFKGGWTGTMVQHGRRVSPSAARSGDVAFYGDQTVPYHTALCIGNGRAISHGRPEGPEIVKLDSSVTQYRRYLEEEK